MERILRAFYKRTGDLDVADVPGAAVQEFLTGKGVLTSTFHTKLGTLNSFYRYLLARGYVERSPLPTVIPKEPERLVPFIYTRSELRRVLDAAYQQRYWCKIEDVAMHALLLLLYGAGLRISEALRLTMADVDMEQRVLTIRETKFYKTRLIPLGPHLFDVLTLYLARRRERGHPKHPDASFLMTTRGQPLNIQLAELSFKRLCQQAHVCRQDGSRFAPRLHDLRHSFAVHRLTAWYKAGADVQLLLPHLSTFLGHVHIRCTQRYLTMTPELLHQASTRFQQYAVSEVPHD
jgi:site-specific recombinase XerD